MSVYFELIVYLTHSTRPDLDNVSRFTYSETPPSMSSAMSVCERLSSNGVCDIDNGIFYPPCRIDRIVIREKCG